MRRNFPNTFSTCGLYFDFIVDKFRQKIRAAYSMMLSATVRREADFDWNMLNPEITEIFLWNF